MFVMARLLARGWFIVLVVLEDVLLELFEGDHQALVIAKTKPKSRLHRHSLVGQQRNVA